MAGRTAARSAISGARPPAISSRAATVRPLNGRRQAFVMKSVIKNKPLWKGEGSRARPARLFRKRYDDLLGQNATQGQCTVPGGVLFASCPTASVLRRQVTAPS